MREVRNNNPVEEIELAILRRKHRHILESLSVTVTDPEVKGAIDSVLNGQNGPPPTLEEQRMISRKMMRSHQRRIQGVFLVDSYSSACDASDLTCCFFPWLDNTGGGSGDDCCCILVFVVASLIAAAMLTLTIVALIQVYRAIQEAVLVKGEPNSRAVFITATTGGAAVGTYFAAHVYLAPVLIGVFGLSASSLGIGLLVLAAVIVVTCIATFLAKTIYDTVNCDRYTLTENERQTLDSIGESRSERVQDDITLRAASIKTYEIKTDFFSRPHGKAIRTLKNEIYELRTTGKIQPVVNC
jgi:hypothetical protein